MPRHKKRAADYVGQTFARLTVRDIVGKDANSNPIAACACSCGGIWQGGLWNITQGLTLSCGCLRRDRAEMMRLLAIPKYARAIRAAIDNVKGGDK